MRVLLSAAVLAAFSAQPIFAQNSMFTPQVEKPEAKPDKLKYLKPASKPN